MSRCTTGCGYSINCSGGCGFLCTTDCTDCTQWCEPAEVEAAFRDDGSTIVRGGITRTRRAKDGTVLLTLNGSVGVDTDGPRYASDTKLTFCLKEVSLKSLALALGAMHTATISAPAHRAHEVISADGEYTLAELASEFGLDVG